MRSSPPPASSGSPSAACSSPFPFASADLRSTQVLQRAGAARALLGVDPGLLDDERLPQARGHTLDLVVRGRLRLADRQRECQPLRALLEVERERYAARHVVG